ncbi:MAG: SDR family oxidoreductase [Blastocatellia bacterium]|nr:SDR family oxidoreductase [Blastocatellia bacterium]
MKSLEKGLLIAAAGAVGLLGYSLLKRQSRVVDLDSYYRDKVVVVTGGASGIGKAIVQGLKFHGAKILAVDLNREALERLEDEIPEISTYAIDLAHKMAPHQLLREVVETFGHVDLVFSNAGILVAGPFLEMTDEEIERLIKVNFAMQVRMTHAFLPYFIERGAGVLAYTGSMSSYVPCSAFSLYTATKGGLNSFVAAIRRELPKRSPIQLTIIHPNVTRTNLTDRRFFDSLEAAISRNFTGSLQSAEEVASAFLKGVARGDKEVLVRPSDWLLVWAERLVPELAEKEIRKLTKLYLREHEMIFSEKMREV